MSGWDNLFGASNEEQEPRVGSEPVYGAERPERVEDLPPRPEPQRPDFNTVADPWFVTPDKPLKTGGAKTVVKTLVSIVGPIVGGLIILGIIVGGVWLAMSGYVSLMEQPEQPRETTVVGNGR